MRARRRYDEMVAKGENPDYNEVLANVRERDNRIRPLPKVRLKKAGDAVEIDD